MKNGYFRNAITHKPIISFLCSLLFLLFLSISIQAAASPFSINSPDHSSKSNQRTVHVGLPDTDTITGTGSDNVNVAFQKDYLQAVAEYANWNYVYVEAPWEKCLEMMKTGKIDVLLDVSKTDERLQYYNYSTESMGTEMCSLFGRSDTKMNYNDYAAFNGMTVGYEEGSTIIDSLRKYGEEQGFTFKTKSYSSGAAMFAALDAGEVDTVAQTNFYDTPAGHVILAKCDANPVYIATNKSDPTLNSELNSAMAQLFSYNPGFNTELYKYHFEHIATKKEGFTQQEIDYLNSKPVINVVYETNWTPFEYEHNGIAEGITPDIIRAIGKDTGITFHFILSSSTQAVYNTVRDISKDTIMAVSYDYRWANSHGLRVTQPYVTGSVMRVTKNPEIDPKTIAVVKDGYLASQINLEYPKQGKIEFLTFSECMDAVNKGIADCTFLNYYQANYYRSMTTYENFTYQPVEDIRQDISLGITTESNPLLLSIFSKSLQHLSSNNLQGILSKNSVFNEQFSIRWIIRRYPLQMALVLGLLGILIGLVIVMSISSDARKRQNLALAAAKEEAEEANHAKTDFLSRMSHDIRTPLNGIIGMTYLANKENNPPQTTNCLSKIETSSKFLLGLVNDILDMSKAESGRLELHPEPYPAEEFVNYMNAVIVPLYQAKNQTLVQDFKIVSDRIPLFDKLRINQIMFNLLSNAVKYTPEGGKLKCSIHENLLSDGRINVSIEVSDNGIGMSEKFQKILFTAFVQESGDTDDRNRGTGLGLAITKKLVDAMGGTISVQSEFGKGSTFTVSLVTNSIPTEAFQNGKLKGEPTSFKQYFSLSGKNILVCEDNEINREIVSTLLSEKGIKVDNAENGQEAVEIFSKSKINFYNAILMDIRMPLMNGYQATKAIRSLDRPDAKAVPIIAMTANAFDEDVKMCIENGMDGHIAKPIEPEKLYSILQSKL